MAEKSSPKASAGKTATPGFDFTSFDFTKMLGQYKLPGVDFAAIVEREKKNIDALTKANKIAFEGWQALMRKQSEILQETMSQTIASASKQDTKARTEVAKQGFEKALDNMRALAEMATKSQKEAFNVIHERFSENMDEMRSIGKAK